MLSGATGIQAQKSLEKQWVAAEIDTVLIDSDAIFRLTIESHDSETITALSQVEGEYNESVVVNSAITGRTLAISTGFSPYFKKDNDKLAAHKVLSVECSLTVPSDMAVVVRSSLASLEARGGLAYLEAVLSDGNITLENFSGDARLETVTGDITVEAIPGVGGRGVSTQGVTKNQLPLEGNYFIEAKSRSGSVVLRKKNL